MSLDQIVGKKTQTMKIIKNYLMFNSARFCQIELNKKEYCHCSGEFDQQKAVVPQWTIIETDPKS